MKIALYGIDHAPPSVPLWDVILEDLGRHSPERIARVLGVGRSTVYRWNQAGRVPRIECLALFGLTRWGRSAAHTQATNDALMAVALARSLECERDQREARLKHVRALADTGSANRRILGN